MKLSELSLIRESVRDYSSRSVEADKLNEVLEAARLAPSACNRQPWKFLVLKSDEARAKAAAAVGKFEWMAGAPVIIVGCVDHSQEWVRGYDGKPHGDIDVAIAAEHICLAAAQQGLGTCWICSFDAKAFASAFNLPGNLEPVVILPLGYPAYEGQRPKQRKALEEIVEIR